MKNLIFIFLILAGLQLNSYSAKFIKLEPKDGVDFYYKWENSNLLDKKSQLVLVLKIDNMNNYPVEVDYTVDYFWQGLTKASSEVQTICIRPQKSLLINAKKQGFDTGLFTNEQIQSEDFMMELSGIEIRIVEECKSEEIVK